MPFQTVFVADLSKGIGIFKQWVMRFKLSLYLIRISKPKVRLGYQRFASGFRLLKQRLFLLVPVV
jgi:hypothetical protein